MLWEDGRSGEGARVTGSCEDGVRAAQGAQQAPRCLCGCKDPGLPPSPLAVRCFCPLTRSESRPAAQGPCGPEWGRLTVGHGVHCRRQAGLAPPSHAPARVPTVPEGQPHTVHSRLSPGAPLRTLLSVASVSSEAPGWLGWGGTIPCQAVHAMPHPRDLQWGLGLNTWLRSSPGRLRTSHTGSRAPPWV